MSPQRAVVVGEVRTHHVLTESADAEENSFLDRAVVVRKRIANSAHTIHSGTFVRNAVSVEVPRGIVGDVAVIGPVVSVIVLAIAEANVADVQCACRIAVPGGNFSLIRHIVEVAVFRFVGGNFANIAFAVLVAVFVGLASVRDEVVIAIIHSTGCVTDI